MKKLLGFLLFAAIVVLPKTALAAVLTTISGNVTTIGGTVPVAGAKLVLTIDTLLIDSTTTDAGGAYAFLGDSAAFANDTGVVRVQASKPNLVTTTSVATPTLNINLALAAGVGNVNGTVRRTSDSTPLVGAKVVLRRGNTNRVDSLLTDGSGRYSFSNTAGNYTLITSDSTYFTTNTTVTLVSSGNTSLTIYLALTVPGTVTGTVRRALDSAVVVGAKVVLRRGSATAAGIDSVVTGAGGVYTFSVAPGAPNYWVTASAAGYATAITNGAAAGLVVGNGLTVTSNFLLLTPGSITGTALNVVSANLTVPITNARVILRRGSATATPSDSVLTNGSGRYTFSNLIPGATAYWITINTNLGSQHADSILVGNGATVTYNFTFTSSAIKAVISNATGIHFSRVGDRLILDLGISSVVRSIQIFNLNGILQHQVAVSVGESRAIVPAAFAPSNGFLFQIK